MEIESGKILNQTSFSLIGKMVHLNDYQKLRNYCNNLRIDESLLIADLSRLTFSSTHGLGIFITVAKTIQKIGKQFILFKPREELLSIIQLIGIDQVIPVIENEVLLRQFIEKKTPKKIDPNLQPVTTADAEQ
ncbi:MAG: STAS domain-containing protein [Chitinivibrionales bacterium]|nr:STAS domain-containing protein [Chitinivibrionales bacterium]